MLTIEFRTSPDAVAELLPAPLTVADEDPGAVAVIWADWQSCSDTFEELLDPVRAQYLETFVVVRCQYQGQTYSRCVYIWVDKDFAMVRGYHQGYPKKLGSLHVTRPVTVGVAGPRLEPGGRFGATCSAYGRRLIDATFTITGTAPAAGFVNGHPMIHHRVFPAIESDGTDSLHELVTMRGYDAEVGPCYAGDATIAFYESPVEELTRLAPERDDRRVLAGGRHELASRDDARAPEPAMTGPAPDGDLGPDDADIADPDTYVAGVPHATFLRLRRTDPVSWWGEDHAGGRGFWAVARHGDLLTVSRDVERFSSAARDPPRGDGRGGDRGAAHDDGARSAGRTRRTGGWSPSRSAGARCTPTRRRSDGLARSVVDAALAGPATFDFVDRVAKQLPMRMLGALLGVPESDGPWLVEQGDALLGNTDPEFTTHPVGLVDTEEFRLMPFRSPAGVELFRYAQEQARLRREHPTDDVISDLLRPKVDGEELSEQEFNNFFTLLVAAGNDTTRYTMTAGMKALIERPCVDGDAA